MGDWLCISLLSFFSTPMNYSVFAGAFAHMWWSPQRAALGASGGVMGMYGFLWSYHQRRGESAQVCE